MGAFYIEHTILCWSVPFSFRSGEADAPAELLVCIFVCVCE
jgi:hypothetical protein